MSKHNFHCINALYYNQLSSDTWEHNQRFFKTESPGVFTHTKKATPINLHNPLIIIIHCIYNKDTNKNQYMLATCFKTHTNPKANWDLVLLCRLISSTNTMITARIIIKTQATLFTRRVTWTHQIPTHQVPRKQQKQPC